MQKKKRGEINSVVRKRTQPFFINLVVQWGPTNGNNSRLIVLGWTKQLKIERCARHPQQEGVNYIHHVEYHKMYAYYVLVVCIRARILWYSRVVCILCIIPYLDKHGTY